MEEEGGEEGGEGGAGLSVEEAARVFSGWIGHAWTDKKGEYNAHAVVEVLEQAGLDAVEVLVQVTDQAGAKVGEHIKARFLLWCDIHSIQLLAKLAEHPSAFQFEVGKFKNTPKELAYQVTNLIREHVKIGHWYVPAFAQGR